MSREELRSTAMGLPKTAHHTPGTDSEGWKMVPLSDLDPLPEFRANKTSNQQVFSPNTELDFDVESTDVSKNVQRDPDINVELNPIGLQPIQKRANLAAPQVGHTPQNRDLVGVSTRGIQAVGSPGLEFESQRTDISNSVIKTEVAKLRVLAGPNRGEERYLNGPYMSVGRALENTFMTLDLAMSRNHFIIQRGDDDGFWLRDNESANGTFLNGERLMKPTILVPGDKIEAGESLIGFVDQWRPVHQQRSPAGASPAVAPIGTTAPMAKPEQKKKFGVAWFFAVLCVIVAGAVLVYALVAGPPASQKDPAEVAYLEATEARRQQDWESAQKKYAEAKSLNPNLEDVDDQLALIDRELQASRALETAKALIKREQYDTAIGELAQVPRKSVYYGQAKTLLKDAVASKETVEESPETEPEDAIAEVEKSEKSKPAEKVVVASPKENDVPPIEKPKEEEDDDDDEGFDLDLGSSKKIAAKPPKKSSKKKEVKLLKVKKAEPEEEEDDEGFDLDLGSSKKKTKKAATKKVVKKPAKKKTPKKKEESEDEDISIW